MGNKELETKWKKAISAQFTTAPFGAEADKPISKNLTQNIQSPALNFKSGLVEYEA